ncbi:TylF/MycF/NovP-related O-methyltransferase [Skermanella stibiiresistens]|nr:TylF/MycF/NovP-related O-methyltransferase [Skermanella stibiiresistens]
MADLAKLDQVSVEALDAIKTLGVKRAKFEAYARAAARGAFLYLDADIVVLDDISELAGVDRIAVCPDDLSGCQGIQNKRFPWRGNPALERTSYFNSGVIAVPAGKAALFADIHQASLDEECWQAHIEPGVLYDNHFLVARLLLRDEPLFELDAEIYNWQGLRDNDFTPVVERRGKRLVNRANPAKWLKIAHFAGVAEPDDFLFAIDPAIGSAIAQAATEPARSSVESPLVMLLAGLAPHFDEPLPDPHTSVLARHLIAELRELTRTGLAKPYEGRGSYLLDRTAMLSLAYSVPTSKVRWNGLQCGGAYLTGPEYAFIEDIVQRHGIRTVIEIGAGETSILFKRLGVDALSIDATEGPWLWRAQEAGCRAMRIGFDTSERLFDGEALERAIGGFSREVDLVFVDSPVGTLNRAGVLDQILSHVSTKRVLFHDAMRDGVNLFRHMNRYGLSVAGMLESDRGMVLCSTGGEIAAVPNGHPADIIIDQPDFRLTTTDLMIAVAPGQSFEIAVELVNQSPRTLSSDFVHPVMLSYHWLNADGTIHLFDAPRTRLPFDLRRGGRASIPMTIVAPTQSSMFRLEIDMVQEGVAWLGERHPAGKCQVKCLVDPNAASAAQGRLPHFVESEFADLWSRFRDRTMVPWSVLYSAYRAARHVAEAGIPGDIVECGVWRGGCAAVMAEALALAGVTDRRVLLFDTFAGMTEPDERDWMVGAPEKQAAPIYRARRQEGFTDWAFATRDEAVATLRETSYPFHNFVLIKGAVEETIPTKVPDLGDIAVLRLDTDFHQSTKHELEHFYPRLVSGGVLICDDYGWWNGARLAFDEYMADNKLRLLLSIDPYSGAALAIKP